MKVAVVTLLIGEKYLDSFNRYVKAGWEKYCKKHNFDLILIEQSLDDSERGRNRSPAWQKLLILSQKWSKNYDRIVWIDSDIMINYHIAGNITNGVPIELVGACDEFRIPSREFHDIALNRLHAIWKHYGIDILDDKLPGDYYTTRGIPGQHLTSVLQTGVMVLSPLHHREIFEKVYYNYGDENGNRWNYEMPALSYELLTANMVHWISPAYNFLVIYAVETFYRGMMHDKPNPVIHFVSRVTNKLFGYRIKQKQNMAELKVFRNIYDLSMFMHFAGYADAMPKVAAMLTAGQ